MRRQSHFRHVATTVRRASGARRPSASRYALSRARPRSIEQPDGAPASDAYKPAFARYRRLPYVLSGLAAGGIGLYSAILFMQARKPCVNPAVAELSQQKDVSGRYEYTADSFDSEVGFSELLMGVNRMRRRLAERCIGHVLEVSCGTGRNLGYYDVGKQGTLESLTLVDLSPQMIDVCKKKWNVLFGNQRHPDALVLKPGLVVRFFTGSALEDMPLPPRKKKYDTIIQTMGLCSTPSPHELLRNMVDHLDTSSPESRILLLEHGRSYRHWLNNILDNAAEKHAEIHGCWFNRDIGALVEDIARQTGLEVVSERRHHIGTTWIFELRPSPELIEKSSTVKDTLHDSQQVPLSWWSWLGLK